jgi:hypothetical protein
MEETVLQVGHLPELYEDARSEKYKISLKRRSEISCDHIPATCPTSQCAKREGRFRITILTHYVSNQMCTNPGVPGRPGD